MRKEKTVEEEAMDLLLHFLFVGSDFVDVQQFGRRSVLVVLHLWRGARVNIRLDWGRERWGKQRHLAIILTRGMQRIVGGRAWAVQYLSLGGCRFRITYIEHYGMCGIAGYKEWKSGLLTRVGRLASLANKAFVPPKTPNLIICSSNVNVWALAACFTLYYGQCRQYNTYNTCRYTIPEQW